MTEDQIDIPPVSKKLTRREFLGLIPVTAGSVLLGTKVGKWLMETYEDKIVEQILKTKLSSETEKMLPEIVTYREMLGLEGLPTEVVTCLLTGEKWPSNPKRFVNTLPTKNQSYGMRISEVIQELFGNNCTQLVKEARMDPDHPWGISFNPNLRACNVSESIHDISIENDFTDYVLHEAVGHGSDPALKGIKYPPETLVKVEHGKWRALSQALSIEEQFFKHPGDLTYPLLKRDVGETVGRFMVDTEKDSSITADKQGLKLVEQAITSIARKRGKRPEELKYNKSVCAELGEELIALRTNGKITFAGGLKEQYQTKLEGACQEIYAEMVKYSLLYPDKINDNRNVIEGVAEVISAIKGSETDIETLRKQTSQVSREVIERNAAEKALLLDYESPSVSTTLTLEEEEIMQQEQGQFESRELAFENFVTQGALPEGLNVTEKQKDLVSNFASLVHKVIQRYPMLKDTFTQKYNLSFDPEVHIWEIREIEVAIDSGFIWNLIASVNIDDQISNEIKYKIEVLEKFVSAPAF